MQQLKWAIFQIPLFIACNSLVSFTFAHSNTNRKLGPIDRPQNGFMMAINFFFIHIQLMVWECLHLGYPKNNGPIDSWYLHWNCIVNNEIEAGEIDGFAGEMNKSSNNIFAANGCLVVWAIWCDFACTSIRFHFHGMAPVSAALVFIQNTKRAQPKWKWLGI